jgi:chemotaxis protein MotB
MSGGGHGKSRRHEEHEEHEEHVNHEAWVIPYADMLTLLMALFLVLFAVGRTDLEKFKKLAEGFRAEFGGAGNSVVISSGGGGEGAIDGGPGVLEAGARPNEGSGGQAANEPTDLQIEQAVQEAAQEAAQEAIDGLQEVVDAVQVDAAQQGVGDQVAFRFEGRGLVLTILNDAVLFESGQASLQPEGFAILNTVIASLRNIPNDITIEGHTDSRPISTTRYPSNWDLSTARATSVLRYFELQGFDVTRLSASGYGDTRPAGDNSTAAGQAQNRRVEIVIQSDISLDPALEIDG